jgi:hypothetical protein
MKRSHAIQLLRPRSERCGQSLLEFALVAFILVTILAATVTLGYSLFAAQALQQAVDFAAQEISRTPFPADSDLGLGRLDSDNPGWVMRDPDFLTRIYNPADLVVYASELGINETFQEHMDSRPLLNRLLAPLMIAERDADGTLVRYRYPGTVVTDPGDNEETVLIPIMGYGVNGAESFIRWVAPVEEIPFVSGSTSHYPFSLATPPPSPQFVPGVVALRLNYPVQSGLSVNQVGVDDNADGRADRMELTEADDTMLLVTPPGRFQVEPAFGAFGPHAGELGLGAMRLSRQGFPIDVRPYRKVLSVQAIYRREVFE